MPARIIEGNTKKCTVCGQEKPIDEFWLHHSKRKDGSQRHRSRCKQCEIDKKLDRYYNKGGKEEQKSRAFKNLMKRYGITPEIYEEERLKQNCKCCLCGKHEDTQPHKRLYVDHCHDTGLYRGLLCVTCNTALGNFYDDVKLMEKAIKYVEDNRARHREQLQADTNMVLCNEGT